MYGIRATLIISDQSESRVLEFFTQILAVLVDVVNHGKVPALFSAPVSRVRPVGSLLVVCVPSSDDVALVMETQPPWKQ